MATSCSQHFKDREESGSSRVGEYRGSGAGPGSAGEGRNTTPLLFEGHVVESDLVP